MATKQQIIDVITTEFNNIKNSEDFINWRAECVALGKISSENQQLDMIINSLPQLNEIDISFMCEFIEFWANTFYYDDDNNSQANNSQANLANLTKNTVNNSPKENKPQDDNKNQDDEKKDNKPQDKQDDDKKDDDKDIITSEEIKGVLSASAQGMQSIDFGQNFLQNKSTSLLTPYFTNETTAEIKLEDIIEASDTIHKTFTLSEIQSLVQSNTSALDQPPEINIVFPPTRDEMNAAWENALYDEGSKFQKDENGVLNKDEYLEEFKQRTIIDDATFIINNVAVMPAKKQATDALVNAGKDILKGKNIGATVSNLGNVAKDIGKNAVNNLNDFAQKKASETVANIYMDAKNIAVGGLDIANNAMDSVDVIVQLTGVALDKINKKINNIKITYTNIIKNDIKQLPITLQERTAYWTKEYIMSNSEILDNFLKVNKTEELQEQQKVHRKKSIDKTIERVTYTIDKISYIYNSTIGTVNEKLYEINSYIYMGTDFVKDKINTLCNSTTSYMSKNVSSIYNNTKKNVDEYVEMIAEEMGKDAAETINNELEKALQSAENNKEQNIGKQKTKAKALATKAKLKIMALLGQ